MSGIISITSTRALVAHLIETVLPDPPTHATVAAVEAAIADLPEGTTPLFAGGAHHWRTLNDVGKDLLVRDAMSTLRSNAARTLR